MLSVYNIIMSDIHDIEVKICCIKLTLAARVIAMIGLVSNYLTCLLPVRSRIIIQLFLMQFMYILSIVIGVYGLLLSSNFLLVLKILASSFL